MLAKAKVGLMQGGTLNTSAVSGDLKLPTPRALGIDGRVYKLSYESSDSVAIRIDTYRGVVTRALEDEAPRTATITASLTYEDVTVRRELGSFTPAVVTNDQIDAAVAFMERVKAAYATALLGENPSIHEVTGDLDTFQSASPALDGSIAWARTSKDCDDTGVVPVDLPGYDPMGSAKWRLFRSSRESVVASEGLRVSRPSYNTDVTIDSSLTYKAFESLAAAHPDHAQLQKLVNQPVEARFTVLGTEGASQPDSDETLTVNARVTGLGEPDADGVRHQEDWIALTEVSVAVDADATAWDVFSELLDDAGYRYEVNAYGPTSITAPDGHVLDNSFTEPYRYWAFFVDGEYGQGDEGSATSCRLKDGMNIELRYVDAGSETLPPIDVPVDPDAEHPDLDVQWGGYIDGGAGAVTNAPTPVDRAELAWAENLLTEEEVSAGASLSVSDPLIIGGKLYLVTGSSVFDMGTMTSTSSRARLRVIDRATGKTEREVELASSMDYTCRPAYADGIIVVPLSGGCLQAVSASSLKTLWVVPASTSGQSMSSLSIVDGYVYLSMFDSLSADGQSTTGGSILRCNLLTGALAGSLRNDAAGYYWAGGVHVDGHFVIGDDAGIVHVFTSDLAREVSRVDVSASPLRSSLVEADGFVYAVSRDDGVLHKLAIGTDGQVREVASVKFAAYSTSTPAIAGGKAFIGGLGLGLAWEAPGILAVVDLATMSVTQVTQADGADILGEVKSAPLVAVRDGGTYVYFTSNKATGTYPNYEAGGGIYAYRVGDTEARLLFQPGAGMANYCMSSVICDTEGNLYYTNDSGHLFKIVSTASGGQGDNGQGNGGQGGNGRGNGSGQGNGSSAGGGQQGGSSDTSSTSRPASSAGASQKRDESTIADEESASLEQDGEEAGSSQDEDGGREGTRAAADRERTEADGTPSIFDHIALVAGVTGAGELAVAGIWQVLARRRKVM